MATEIQPGKARGGFLRRLRLRPCHGNRGGRAPGRRAAGLPRAAYNAGISLERVGGGWSAYGIRRPVALPMLVYLVRNVNPKYLAMAVPLVAVIDFGSGVWNYQSIRAQRIAYVQAVKVRDEKRALTDTQTKALSDWRELEKTMIPNREDAKANTVKMKSGYSTVADYLRPIAFQLQTKYLPVEIWDSVALMMLGLALYKWGFLTGNWLRQDYWKVVVIGYAIGLPLVTYSVYYGFKNFSTLEANLARMERVPINWVGFIYPFQRVLLVMAHAAAIILVYRSGWGRGFFRRLEAVGRMAFTNYIMHSLICTLFFFQTKSR